MMPIGIKGLIIKNKQGNLKQNQCYKKNICLLSIIIIAVQCTKYFSYWAMKNEKNEMEVSY